MEVEGRYPFTIYSFTTRGVVGGGGGRAGVGEEGKWSWRPFIAEMVISSAEVFRCCFWNCFHRILAKKKH